MPTTDKGLKLAVAGKGGVGKSTIAAAMALLMARAGRHVLAVDADPNYNLGRCLGFPADALGRVVPISGQFKLIEERTGAKVREYGQMFRLNPDVSDVAEKIAVTHDGISLVVLGPIEKGGSGCACPENVFIRALVSDVVLNKNQAVIMDMEAGLEHMGRATARGVDMMLVVVEPGQRSIECAERVLAMASDISLANVRIVANKVTSQDDEAFITNAFPGVEVAGVVPYCDSFRRADRNGTGVLDGADEHMIGIVRQIVEDLRS